MPYIKEEDRERIHLKYGSFGEPALTPGELNYHFTLLIDSYLSTKGLNYQHINDVVGALECAKMELYRRIAGPYEDKKILGNGDVYSSQLLN